MFSHLTLCPTESPLFFYALEWVWHRARGCDLCNITRLSFSNYSLIDLVLVNKHSVLNACFGQQFS